MANSNDEQPRSEPAATVRSNVPLPEQTFFADPVLDRLMGVTMALAAEVYILRSRLRTLERSQRRAGHDPDAAGELSAAVAEAEQQDAAAFVAHLFEPAIGEQQARGPL